MVDDDDKGPGVPGQSGPGPRRPQAPSITSEGQRGGVNAPQSTVNAQDIVGGSKTVNNFYGGGQGSNPPWTPSPPIRRYLAWLAGQRHQVPLRGVGGGDLSLTLAQTYVSLNLEVTLRERQKGREYHCPSSDGRDFPIASIFVQLREGRSKHALLLGDPGSGKSTALRKLGQLIGEQARRACGVPVRVVEGEDTQLAANSLGPRYLPVFVRLREWRDDDNKLSLKDFICREILKSAKPTAEADAPPLSAEDVDALWTHGALVLLLDGLDEITSAARRAEFCDSLATALSVPSNQGLRVVLTCRYAGYDEEKLKLVGARGFGRAALQPLSKEQARLLIMRWFAEVADKQPEILDQPRAIRYAEGLAQALDDSRFGDYRRAMFATPLIVTLLCVIQFRGRKLPQNRAELYELCLEVMLVSWHQAKRDDARVGEPRAADPERDEPEPTPADPEAEERKRWRALVINILRPLAHKLHSSQDADTPESTEQLDYYDLLAYLFLRLEELGSKHQEEAVFRWLHERAAVLDEIAPGSYGFFHLGVQEYLTALEIALRGDAALGDLAERVGDSWWHEVILLAASLHGRGAFAPLMTGLLEHADLNDSVQWRLLRDCVTEGDFTPEPFDDRFRAENLDNGPRLRAIFRLVKEKRHPLLVESLRALAKRDDADSGARHDARQRVAEIDALAAGERPYHVAVVGLDDAVPQVRELVRLLQEKTGLSVWPSESESPALAGIDVTMLREKTAAVVAVVGERLPWGSRAPKAARSNLLRLLPGRSLAAVFAPGSRAEFEPWTKPVETFKMPQRWDLSALVDHLRPKPAAAPGSTDGLIERLHTPSVEPTTGMRLLWVPGDTFRMGSDSDELNDDSRPVHLVKVEPFWIGETPVTNEQYRAFVIDAGHPEPRAWRQRGFNDPQQPVVTVSWDDATAFCRWLSERSGWAVDLPSEAQWEYAARGKDGHPYPWGEEHPDATRAHFNQGDGGRPAVVGSYPAGAGPFGTLDQAGNVWEWCKDVWDADAYKARARPPAVNTEQDVLGAGSGRSRSLRGGSWGSGGGALAAACRHWGWRVDGLGHRGFRVLVSREPVDP